MSIDSLSAPQLGNLAYEYLLTVIEEVIENKQKNWVETNRSDDRYHHLFADLAYTVFVFSESDGLGQERLFHLIDDYVAAPFASAVHNAISIVDSDLIHGILTGVKPFMLTALFDETRWKPLIKRNRGKPLLLMVDNTPQISEGIRDLLELEGLYPDIIDIDLTPQDSGALCLICALAFEPDFMFADIMLVGISGVDMMWFIQKWLKPKQMPYFLLTAYTDKNHDSRMIALYDEANIVLYKPYPCDDLIVKVREYIELAGFIKE